VSAASTTSRTRRIKLEEASSARLGAVDGDVEIGCLDSPAEISTARVDIRVAEATRGTVTLCSGCFSAVVDDDVAVGTWWREWRVRRCRRS
jgi:hypothetical protein